MTKFVQVFGLVSFDDWLTAVTSDAQYGGDFLSICRVFPIAKTRPVVFSFGMILVGDSKKSFGRSLLFCFHLPFVDRRVIIKRKRERRKKGTEREREGKRPFGELCFYDRAVLAPPPPPSFSPSLPHTLKEKDPAKEKNDPFLTSLKEKKFFSLIF